MRLSIIVCTNGGTRPNVKWSDTDSVTDSRLEDRIRIDAIAVT